MKDFTTIKFLITELEDVTKNLNERIEAYRTGLDYDLADFNKFSFDKSDNSYHYTDEDGSTKEVSRWDYEWKKEQIDNAYAKMQSVQIIIDTLSNIDLNKVTKAGDKK